MSGLNIRVKESYRLNRNNKHLKAALENKSNVFLKKSIQTKMLTNFKGFTLNWK